MLSEHPLISAIMPTRARPEFARNAVLYFLAQTWPNKELVIVDDALSPSFRVAPEQDFIRYLSISRGLTIGAKRNRACAESHGLIICHWDDDDWSAPERMTDQAERLISSEAEITGYSDMEFRDGSRRWFYSGGNGYIIGTSFMYWRQTWQQRPFQMVNTGEDLLFQDKRKTVSAPARGLMLGTIHPGNTCPRSVDRHPWREIVAETPCYA